MTGYHDNGHKRILFTPIKKPQNGAEKWVMGNSVGHRVDGWRVPNLADALGFVWLETTSIDPRNFKKQQIND
jgi:hypothetical protein